MKRLSLLIMILLVFSIVISAFASNNISTNDNTEIASIKSLIENIS